MYVEASELFFYENLSLSLLLQIFECQIARDDSFSRKQKDFVFHFIEQKKTQEMILCGLFSMYLLGGLIA
jgi:hypothetical protein